MTADEKLALIRAKINWAKKHIDDFDAIRQPFLASKPYAYASKKNSATGYEELYLTEIRSPPPEVGPIAGDALHNLRSALDHLAYHLVFVGTNGAGPFNNTYFPIFDSPEKYKAGRNGKIKGASDAAKEALDRIEPYQGGKGQGLWVLHALDIADKHRGVLTGITCVTEAIIPLSISPLSRRQQRTVGFSVPGFQVPLEPGDVFLTYDPNLHHDVDVAFDISFGKSEIFEGKRIIETLQRLSDLVDNIVQDFESMLV